MSSKSKTTTAILVRTKSSSSKVQQNHAQITILKVWERSLNFAFFGEWHVRSHYDGPNSEVEQLLSFYMGKHNRIAKNLLIKNLK
jgi:hypothetical protein